MDTVLEGDSFRLAESSGRITLAPKHDLFMVKLGGLAILAGALTQLLSRWSVLGPTLTGRVPSGLDIVVVAAGSLLLVLGVLVNVLKRPIVFDCNQWIMTIGRRTYSFVAITGFRLATMAVGSRQLFVLFAIVDGKECRLISGYEEAPMKMLAEHLNRRVVLRPARPPKNAAGEITPRQLAAGRYLMAAICLGIGSVWSAGAYVFFPDMIFVHHTSAEHGPLLWPLGLWIVALGLCELAGVQVWRLLSQGSWWRRNAIGLLFFGTYFFLCWR